MFPKIIFLLEQTKVKKFFFLILISLQTLIDLAGVGLVFPLVNFLVNDNTVSSLSIFNISISINMLITIILIFFALKFFFSVFLNYKILIFGKFIKIKLQETLIKQYQQMSFLDFLSRDRSYYFFKTETLTKNFSDLVISLLRTFCEVFAAFFIIIFLGYISWKFLLALTFFFIISVILFDFSFKKKFIKLGKISNQIYSKMLKNIYDIFDGYLDIKIFNKENFFLKRAIFASKKSAIIEANFEIYPISTKYYLELVIMLIFSISFFYFLRFKSDNFIFESLPIIITFGVAAIKLMPIFNTLMRTSSLVRRFKDTVNILYDDFKEISKVSKKQIINKKLNINDKFSNPEKFKRLRIKSLNYSFNKKQILKDINITINKNDFVGLIGKSGSGKTSLINIICGIYPNYSGKIFFNDKNLKSCMKAWKDKISYIPQSSFLINDSIKRNITFDNKPLNKKIFSKALSGSKLKNFLSQKKSGIEFKIGDKGSKISGGQKQRLLIARSFYHDREIIIFDESTSALDSEIEEKIFNDLKKLKGQFTAIFISHNKNLLKFCNKVYELKNKGIKTVKNEK